MSTVKKKYKFWLLLFGIGVIATLFLWLGEPKLPGISAFFSNKGFGIISLVLYLSIIFVLLIKFVAAKVFGINLVTMKKISPREHVKKEKQETKAAEEQEKKEGKAKTKE